MALSAGDCKDTFEGDWGKGKTTVVKAGGAFEKLAENRLEGFVSASPAVDGKALLVRNDTHLIASSAP